ncbi:MAG TPA: glycosyltransferase family 4 protein [Bacteroidia bacterium]|nr:glycosyltransferase family 4 protein [Bacteroidia bacterium]
MKKRLAYLSTLDPRNKRIWSGTHYSIYRELQNIGEVVILGPYQPRFRIFLCRILNQIMLRVFGRRFNYRHSVIISKAYGRYFTKQIQKHKPDLVVAPAAAAELAFLKGSVPVIYITDGTFAACLNYHEGLKNLLSFNIREGNRIEHDAMKRSALVVVPSVWAYNSALKDYGMSPEKLCILPFGANFELLPDKALSNTEPIQEWKLLFVGVYWENKGGEIAFNTFKILHDKGYPVSFTVLGCTPPSNFSHPRMKVIPFIDKNQPSGQDEISRIYSEHHFLILPTRFDCSPIVINEASAFSIPSLVSRTGGVESHLREGKNGFLVDYHDKGEAYAAIIERYILDPSAYSVLRHSTRQTYETVLNWTHWRTSMASLIESLTKQTL